MQRTSKLHGWSWLCIAMKIWKWFTFHFPSGSLRQTIAGLQDFPTDRSKPLYSILDPNTAFILVLIAVAGQQLFWVTPFKISQIQTSQVHMIYSCLHYTRPWFSAHTQTFLPSNPPYLVKGVHTLASHFYQCDLHHRQRVLIYSCKGEGGNKKHCSLRFCGLWKREVVLTGHIQAVLSYKYTSVSTLNALGVLLTSSPFCP